MDQPNTPNNLPNNEPSDLSYQVMPQEGQRYEPSPAPVPSPLSAKTGPVKPNLMPTEEETSIWRNKWIYIIGGAVVLLILGGLIYFLVGAKKSSTPAPVATTTKLPKVWLQQYFAQNLDTSGNCNDQTICGDTADPDSDGLNNYDEFKAGTNPTNPDTGGSGIADGDAVHIYHTDPTLKYNDRRDIVAQNNWTDGYQIRNGYDPLTPGLKFSDERKTQIATDTSTYALHEPTITTLNTSTTNSTPPALPPANQVTPPPPIPASKAATHNVTIQNLAFAPATITVNKGDTVVWTNKDSVAHTVTGTAGGPASPSIAAQGTYSFTFPATGTFAYHCTIHPMMTGTVVVN